MSDSLKQLLRSKEQELNDVCFTLGILMTMRYPKIIDKKGEKKPLELQLTKSNPSTEKQLIKTKLVIEQTQLEETRLRKEVDKLRELQNLPTLSAETKSFQSAITSILAEFHSENN